MSPRPRRAAIDAPGPDAEPTAALGTNLRRLRTRRGLSLERLAGISGVSRAMLSQIERGRSTPTINVLWKVANALAVPFSTLLSSTGRPPSTVLRAADAVPVASVDGTFVSRALFPLDAPRRVEFYELRLAGGAVHEADPHPEGTVELLVAASGSVEIVVGRHRALLAERDAIRFHADVPHAYRNGGASEARLYLVMSYDVAGR